jgi:hypothetical protein
VERLKTRRNNFGVSLGKHRANYHGARVKKWIPQGARHSFCSYWMAAHDNNVDRLVVLSGHTSKESLWKHYFRQASKHEAEKFWSIMPPNSASNIVSFPAA